MKPVLLLLLLAPWLSQCASLRLAWNDCGAHPPPQSPALWRDSLQGLFQIRLSPLNDCAGDAAHCGDSAAQSVLVALRRDTHSLHVQALSPLGVEWLQVEWQGEQLKMQRAAALPETLDPRMLIADIQLTHWPLASLHQAYAGSAWQVQQQDQLRQLQCAGVPVAQVQYPQSGGQDRRIILSNLLAGYRLEILPLSP